MRMRLTDPTVGEVIFERSVPDGFQTAGRIEQSQIKIDHAFGEASFEDVWFDGINISYGSIQLRKSISLKAECDTPIVEMHFSLSGTSEATMVGSSQKVRFEAGQHNVGYMPEFEGYFHSEKQRDFCKLLEIHVTEEYFRRFANGESVMMDRFQERIEKKETSMLHVKNMQITASMHHALDEIINCKRQGMMKRLFLEARLLELLMLQIEQFESDAKVSNKVSFKSADLEKLHYAKDLIEQNISAPYTLAQLSRAVGLNDFKLKKGFRETFGNTVFGYLHELRMQEARRMLLDRSKSIMDVSDYCGYAYVQHFTTAFRTKFGVTPGSFRLS